MLVFVEGHDIKKDLEELLRLCFQVEDIEFIDSGYEYINGLLFYNKIYFENGEEKLISKIYNDRKLVGKYESLIDDVEVHIDSINKKRNVSIKKSIVELTNKKDKLPWGILTGIRPVKILHDLFDKGISKKEIIRVLKYEYLIWDEKIKLLIEVARKQRYYIRENKNKYSIYISIPFCPTRCLYCSFPSLPIESYEDLVEKYVDMILYEIDETLSLMPGEEINTVYIGGGTPTSIEKKQLKRIIDHINKKIGLGKIEEYTVEAGRPDTIDLKYLEMLKANGVGRISINPQTMNDKTLKIMGRDHSSKDIIEVYKKAERLKFDSINMDIIIGLPGEGIDEVKYTLDEIRKLDPNNLTVHTLAVKTGSKFKNRLDEFDKISNGEMEDISRMVGNFTKEMGLKPYYLYRQKQSVSNLENVGYGKDGNFCVYNISMMEEKETILGIGMGSVSKIYLGNGRVKRVPNFKGIYDYIDRIDELILRKKKALDKR